MASIEEIRAERIKKLNILKEAGINPYPIETSPDSTVGEAISSFTRLSKKKSTKLVGRIMAIRGQGALSFFNFSDGTGTLQGMLKKGDTKDAALDLFNRTVDIGDFVEIQGKLFTTKRKEKTILVSEWRMLSKSLRPLPDKWHGLQDVEERFRKRYLDTLMSPEVRERFVKRAQIISETRSFLDKAGYVETETPILQPLAGGATAEPFETHHNALEINLNLRIAPELYLKELLVGGYTRVYELSRNFRNEGIDVTHNPEFTMLEFYEAYSDAKKQMVFVEKLLVQIVKKVLKKTEIDYDGETINFGKKFATVSYFDLLKRYALVTHPETATREELVLMAQRLAVPTDKADASEKIMDNIYKKTCRPKLIQPTFIIDYPAASSPFAKKNEKDSTIIDRFQLVVGGIEIVNAFSELNDPIDQRERYLLQDKKKRDGEAEVSPSDETYLEAMEYGMPPAGGVGIGIDRLVMILTGQKNIREVILFPTLRPKN